MATSPEEPEAVLITGAYGSGKTTIAVELAGLLEYAGVRFAALDLDWLSWVNLEDGHGEAGHRLMLANLAAVVGNDRRAGMDRFVISQFIGSRSQLDTLRAALDMPLRVVRLVLDEEQIARRLGGDPTSGRQDDLRRAREQVRSGAGEGLEDLAVVNDRPPRDIAADILAWLGWGMEARRA